MVVLTYIEKTLHCDELTLSYTSEKFVLQIITYITILVVWFKASYSVGSAGFVSYLKVNLDWYLINPLLIVYGKYMITEAMLLMSNFGFGNQVCKNAT